MTLKIRVHFSQPTNSIKQMHYAVWDSSQAHASNHSQQTEQSSSSNRPLDFSQELQKEYPGRSDGASQTSQPTYRSSPHMSPTGHVMITAFEKYHPSSLTA